MHTPGPIDATLEDPEGYWAEQAGPWTGSVAPAGAGRRPAAVLPVVPGRPAEHLLQRARPARRGRPGRPPALHYDSPVTGSARTLTYAQLLEQVSASAGRCRPSAWARATGWSSTCRWCPRPSSGCSRARGSGRCTRSSSAGSPRASWRPASRTHGPRSCSRPRAGSSPPASWSTTDIDTAIEMSEHQPDAASSCSGRRPRPRWSSRGRRLGRAHIRRRTRPECVTVAATDPLYVLYTSGTTGQPKGIVRDNGGHAVAMAWSLRDIYGVARARSGGPPRRRLGGRPLLHRLRATDHRRPPRCSTRASRSARLTQAPSGG